ncbi:MAG: nucleotidyltransferase domain-containing protein [Candidatus Taylorbacteria bacterium]
MNTPLIIAFGSQINGKKTDMSDHDFGVLKDAPYSLSERVGIAEYLAKKFDINEDKIDLVDLSSASPLLKFEVARNGQLVDGNYDEFIRFKVRAFKEYVDTAKFRRLREKIMMKKYA